MTGAAPPPAKPPAPSHDDGLHDAVALIEAAAREDFEAVAVLSRTTDHTEVIAALVQIVGSEHEACGCIQDGTFRARVLAAAEGGSP